MKHDEISSIVNAQRSYFGSFATLDIQPRIDVLKRLRSEILKNENRIAEAIKADLGKSTFESYMCETDCPECGGTRLKKEALAITVGDKNIHEICELSVVSLIDFLETLSFDSFKAKVAEPIVKEIKSRLNFLKSVGLDYLTLSRTAGTLSGGESQRIRLATQIGSSLMGVLYILDEPSIGLHQRDNEKLIETLKHLRDLGNTLIVV